ISAGGFCFAPPKTHNFGTRAEQSATTTGYAGMNHSSPQRMTQSAPKKYRSEQLDKRRWPLQSLNTAFHRNKKAR
ncbi:hypothetical protein, partial [Variovorax sp. 553]|uniref:hypothetical protein n=1 Tax=Variovorax sp. 553 TaxID=2496118 RepID=UPI00197E97A0